MSMYFFATVLMNVNERLCDHYCNSLIHSCYFNNIFCIHIILTTNYISKKMKSNKH